MQTTYSAGLFCNEKVSSSISFFFSSLFSGSRHHFTYSAGCNSSASVLSIPVATLSPVPAAATENFPGLQEASAKRPNTAMKNFFMLLLSPVFLIYIIEHFFRDVAGIFGKKKGAAAV